MATAYNISDKVFATGVYASQSFKIETYLGNFDEVNLSRKVSYAEGTTQAASYWLRSSAANDIYHAVFISDTGIPSGSGFSNSHAIRPAFVLKLN